MFDFGRDLRRLFQAPSLGAAWTAPRDGVAGGDAALLELLDLNLLRAEARSADVAAGRVGAEDRPRLQLAAAAVWRELARRTADAEALRKGAVQAELSAEGFAAEHRTRDWAAARLEQARLGLLGAELLGDDGLNAAADFALTQAREKAGPTLAGSVAAATQAAIEARSILRLGDAERAAGAASLFDGPLISLDVHARGKAVGRIAAAQARADRADLLIGAGLRMKDSGLVSRGLMDLARAAGTLDPAYEPLTWSRIETLRGAGLAALGELTGDIGLITDGVDALGGLFEHLTRDHSPLDWARSQQALGVAVQALAEATGSEPAWDQAGAAFDRALAVVSEQTRLPLRAVIADNRAVSLARRAEAFGDLSTLDAAETALKAELAAMPPARDPVAWAARQTNLARLYEARAEITGRDHGERAAAAVALTAALEVFSEHGLRSLSDIAAGGLARLREAAH